MDHRTDPPAELARLHRTASVSRAISAIAGVVLVAGWPSTHPEPTAALAGFAILLLTACIELRTGSGRFTILEEAVGASATLLIVGLGGQRVTALTLLWLTAVVAGILARGGRIHWAGRAILAAGLILPGVVEGRVDAHHVAFCVGAVGLLLCTGRLTRELAGMLTSAQHSADHDGLTGALSRSAFRRLLDDRIVAGRTSVLVVDLDGFGLINKIHGHAAGDRTLLAAAGRMRDALGGGDRLGRLGGDEFAIATQGERPTELAERVRASLGAGGSPIGASIGVANAPDHGSDADNLLRAADIAQRIAKRHGKGRVSVFDGHSLTNGPAGARGALERLIAGEGIAVLVQPIFDIEAGSVHAYEALTRFRTRSSSSPLHWFALAEEYDLRAELELSCLRSALKLLESLPDGARLSVNLSARLLGDARAMDQIDALSDVERLIIEVTEDSLIGDEATAAARSRYLDKGVAFAVDDVGAGYSGLRQITLLRPDYLKLDRSLVHDIDASPEQAALVEAMVGYAGRTGSRLVAEGVETEAELAVVRELGGTLIQGYLLARPAEPWPVPLLPEAFARR